MKEDKGCDNTVTIALMMVTTAAMTATVVTVQIKGSTGLPTDKRGKLCPWLHTLDISGGKILKGFIGAEKG